MAYELVAYKKLRQSLIDAIITLIKSYSPYETVSFENIESKLELIDNKNGRRDQAFYIFKTIVCLDNISDAESDSQHRKSMILNAVAYYVWYLIDESYKGFPFRNQSVFYSSLSSALSLTKTNQPDPFELKTMYASLLLFLEQQVFIKGMAFKGFSPKKLFEYKEFKIVDVMNQLSDLTNQYLKLERNLAKIYRERQIGSEKTSDTMHFNIKQISDDNILITPDSELSSEQQYYLLRNNILTSILQEIQKHATKDLRKIITHDNMLDYLETLNKTPTRKTQVQILLKTIELLDSSLTRESYDVLRAMSYYICATISEEYPKTGVSSWIYSEESSNLLSTLKRSLGLLKVNPENREIKSMYSTLQTFLCAMVYNESSPKQGYLDKQAFAIDGFNVIEIIDNLGDQINVISKNERTNAKNVPVVLHGGVSNSPLRFPFASSSSSSSRFSTSSSSSSSFSCGASSSS